MPTIATCSGRMTDVRALQLRKAYAPISVSAAGKETPASDVQP